MRPIGFPCTARRFRRLLRAFRHSARPARRRLGAQAALIALGLAVWSAMTRSRGSGATFGQLAAARIGVGIGEASATPAAFSLLSDYFPAGAPRHRARDLLRAASTSGAGLGSVWRSAGLTRARRLGTSAFRRRASRCIRPAAAGRSRFLVPSASRACCSPSGWRPPLPPWAEPPRGGHGARAARPSAAAAAASSSEPAPLPAADLITTRPARRRAGRRCQHVGSRAGVVAGGHRD
jgi:hypothetical protein